MGQSYILGCPDGGEQSLLAAVASVDKEMCGIRDAGRVKARERIAVLAALNLAYQLAERPPAHREAAAPSHRANTNDAKSSVDVDALIARVDAALGEDQLL